MPVLLFAPYPYIYLYLVQAMDVFFDQVFERRPFGQAFGGTPLNLASSLHAPPSAWLFLLDHAFQDRFYHFLKHFFKAGRVSFFL